MPTPENCSRGVALQFKSFEVKFVLTNSAIARQASRKDEKERFALWTGAKIVTLAKERNPTPSGKYTYLLKIQEGFFIDF